MESIKEIYRIGHGPSSSHTMGPFRAATFFKENFADAVSYQVVLYGSLAATGKGHLTDKAIIKALEPKQVEIEWQPTIFLERHPNALKFTALDSEKKEIGSQIAYSVGGGRVVYEGIDEKNTETNIYPLTTMTEVMNWTKQNGKMYWQYVKEHENADLYDHLEEVWNVMKAAAQRGIDTEGSIPGGLNLPRKAPSFYIKGNSYTDSLKRRSMIFAFALAVAEENACGGVVVTAPTCGSCGVLASVLYVLHTFYNFATPKILNALATAGLIGNIVKENASISGAEVGCQGEIGVACAMAAGAASQLFGGTPAQIEYAASIALEHFLGLTCDPVCGLVQIPCIERNAVAAARSLDANLYAILSDGQHLVSFDKVVRTMKQTGKDLPSIYKETSGGGLAVFAHKNE
ncbi:MAG: L-serine ammonia-lyase [Bacteroidales bacterium]|nr:L-serine ammonia-lyase [Bacteroidales bacterium]